MVLQNAPFTSRVKLHGDIPAIEGRMFTNTHRSIVKKNLSRSRGLYFSVTKMQLSNILFIHIYSTGASVAFKPLTFIIQFLPWSSIFGFAVTRFPRPASPLQDVATIIGSREMLSALLQLYDHQLEHEGTTGWESLLWVVNQL